MTALPRAWRLTAVWILGVASLATSLATAQTWAERLGYGKGKRVLILHADDIGMCYEANAAAKQLLGEGAIQSAAAMVPCSWFDEFVAWYRDHPSHDVGLHLALTSEWKHYRWGPVSPRAEVPGLLDEDGYLWREVPQVLLRAKPQEVERELRSQVERALERGMKPTHLDTHMGTLFARPEFTAAYFKVAQEYGIPAMAIEPTAKVVAQFRKKGYPIGKRLRAVFAAYPLPKLDAFHSVPRGDSYDEVRRKLFELLRSLEPGITEVIFHPSHSTEGLKKITNSWQQRVWEAELFRDPKVQQFLQQQKFESTTWREMMRRWKARHVTPR